VQLPMVQSIPEGWS